MSLPTPPTNGQQLSADQARAIGHQLAEHPLLAARAGDARPGLAEVLTDARPLLSTYGVSFETLRTRPGLVVVRARSEGKISALAACELVKGLLASIAEQVCDVRSSLVENTCANRGGPACLYSMVWEHQPATMSPPVEPSSSSERDVGEPGDRGDGIASWDLPVRSQSDPTPSRVAVEPVARAASATAPPRPEPVVASTATSSTSYQFQVSTPTAIVVPASTPAPVAPPAPAPALPEPTAVIAPTSAPETVRATTGPRRNFPRGLVRRSWLLVLALVAGSTGGWFAGAHAGTSYGAQAVVVVQSGAGKTGPGSANDALALATTYSALIPKDQSILSAASGVLDMSNSAVASDLSVTVEEGTSLLQIDFTASSAARAIAGAQAVARAVSSTTPVTAAIAAGSIGIVSVPTSAHRQGTLHKDGVVLGGFLGLVVGLILVLAAERADPRIDDAPAMATASGCRAALVPSDLSFAELARVLADAGRTTGLTIVPVQVTDTTPTMELARGLRPCWPVEGPVVSISPSFSAGVVELSRGTGPTVLVSHPGTRQRDVLAAAERLRMIGRAPVWAVLTNRRLRSRVSDRVG
jgi:capsular polysaccharide biosynthesis protein